jgi:hypothetical protein
MDQDNIALKVRESDDVAKYTQTHGLLYQLRLAYYFEEYDLGFDLVKLCMGEDVMKGVIGQMPLLPTAVMSGMICFAKARETGKKKYTKLGMRFLQQIKTWCRRGCPHSEHYVYLLEAEKASISGKKDKTIEKYRSSILLSGRQGIIHDRALANECLGKFYMQQGEEEDGLYYLREARKLYFEWGARGKATQLDNKFPELTSLPLHVGLGDDYMFLRKC